MATARRVPGLAPRASDDLAATRRLSATGHRLRFTSIGLAGLGALLAISGAALNTANNLLYLLAALLISAFAISAWLARATLRRVRCSLIVPRETTAGTPLLVLVRLEHAGSGRGAAGLVVHVEGSSSVPGIVPWLAPGAHALLTLSHEGLMRGRQQLRLVLRSPFPWGLLEATRVEVEADILVLPAPLRSGAADPLLVRSTEGHSLTLPGEGAEILDIRPHRQGDDARRVDWKATARTGVMMIRQHSAEEDKRAIVAIDPLLPHGAAPEADALAERAISRAAACLEDLARTGHSLRLLAPGLDIMGSEHELMRELALLQVRRRRAGEPRWSVPRNGKETLVILRAEDET